MIFLWRLWRIKPRFTRAILCYSFVVSTGSRSFWKVAVECVVVRYGLQDEQALDPLALALEDFWFLLKPSLAARFLVQELVIVVRLPPQDFPRSRDLEPLCCRLVCFQLWHSFYFPSAAWDSGS